MILINLNKAIEYAKEKDYIKTSNQERALREVFELSKVNAMPIETIDKIKAEIKALETSYCGGYIGLSKQEVLDIIDKHIGGKNDTM